jgi:hypothetical protein
MRRARGERTVALAEPSTEGLDRQVERMADVRALLRDLHKLPEDQRTALVLFELGDLAQAEIAQVLDCDAGRVKSLVFRARSNLLAAREARDASCSSIRRELAVARGGELNSGALRRHLDGCESCTLYLENVRRQRRALGVVVPVLPAAGLYGRLAGSSGAGGTAADGASRLPFGSGRGRAAAAGAGAATALVLAAVLGLSAGGDGESEAATAPPRSEAPAPASSERASAAQRSGESTPPPAVRSSPPPAQSPSLDAYETDGPAIQGAIGEGGEPGGGAGNAPGTPAAAGQGGAGSGSALPFTGVDVVAISAAGLLLLGLGFVLRRLPPAEEA